MTTISTRTSGLTSTEKRALLGRLLQKKAVGPRSFPVSFAQQRLWFIDQFEPGNPAYNVPLGVRLTGPLDVPALEQSLQTLVRRHDTLRTTFKAAADGQPVQAVARAQPLPLPVLELEAVPVEQREAEAERLATELARQPFDLARGPLFRCSLVRLSREDHVLLVNMHHVISDVWSLGVLVHELITLYEALTAGIPAVLPELPIQYGNYAVWQREQMKGELLEKQLRFWREQVEGAPATLALPTDHPRPSVQTYEGAKHVFPLSEEVAHSLRGLSAREGCSLFMTLLAAFETLLHRHSGDQDFCIGTPIANRTRAETEGLIGFFANTLVFRADVGQDPTFRELMQRVRERALGAYAHQDLPFERLVEELQPDRDLSHHPLFQVLFVFQNAPLPALEVQGLKLTRWEIDGKTSKFDLSLFVIDAGPALDLPFEKLVEELQPSRDLSRAPLFQALFVFQNGALPPLEFPGLRASMVETDTGTSKFDLTWFAAETEQGVCTTVEFNSDLFEPTTVRCLLRHWQTLLKSIVADPGRKVSDYDLLSEPDRRQQLIEWNNTRTPYRSDACLHDLFQEQVERAPDATAVIFENERLTYRELNRRANRLAHQLRGLGVGPDTLVGLYMERSTEMVVGLLATLKAGGAYVPLDPAYPKERLAFMLEDSNTAVLLTQQRLHGKLPEYAGPLVCLDAGQDSEPSHDEHDPATETTAANLAYVFYTSGSTGRPKGVAMPHGPLVNLIQWQIQHSTLTSEERTLQFTTLSFDVAFQEIFATWCAGGTLVLVREEQRRDLAGLPRLLAEQSIARLFLPFVALQQLAEACAFTDCYPDRLKEVITAGEQLHVTRAIAQLFSRLAGCTLYNQFGPTEAHVVTQFPLQGRPADWPDLPPIGRPIANCEAYVLDDRMRLLPPGCTGELYLGGACLARGYLNRPELTAERFLAHPFAPGQRLYRTGDLARWLPAGDLEFLGRRDHQVKIRGFRVELGEIEAVLAQHPEVHETVVALREDVPGDKRLVAYIVGNQERPASVQDLRAHLQARLPEYMVPSAFVFLDRLPTTPSGKVDRGALAPPEQGPLEEGAAYVAPRTPTEELLAGVWRDVLHLERIGIHDSFFELGGHSLQSMQLVARISKALGREVPVRLLFLHPTIAALAEALAQSGARSPVSEQAPAPTQPVPMQPMPTQPVPHLTIERRPLLNLFAVRKLAPVQAAAIGYLPSALLRYTNVSPEQIIHEWCADLPLVTGVFETHLGRIATILIPRFDFELYEDQNDLLNVLTEAVETAGRLGTQTVSLTGLIPSAIDQGRALASLLRDGNGPRITTGAATTTAAVALNVRKILTLASRDFATEQVAFLGLGSVGVSCVRLLLSCLPHPAEIHLCDLYEKRSRLDVLAEELRETLGYRGVVRIHEARDNVPPEIYEASFILGATNVPDVLDANRLRPGTLLVDDSSPHCVNPDQAVARFERSRDILVTEGGVIWAPQPIERLLYLPKALETYVQQTPAEFFGRYDPYYLTGCVFASLLSSRFEHLAVTEGDADQTTCLAHYETLTRLGFDAAPLNFEAHRLQEALVQEFRARFGHH